MAKYCQKNLAIWSHWCQGANSFKVSNPGQWLWNSWQSGRLRHQGTRVRIQQSAIFKKNISLILRNCWRDVNKGKMGREWPIKKVPNFGSTFCIHQRRCPALLICLTALLPERQHHLVLYACDRSSHLTSRRWLWLKKLSTGDNGQ